MKYTALYCIDRIINSDIQLATLTVFDYELNIYCT